MLIDTNVHISLFDSFSHISLAERKVQYCSMCDIANIDNLYMSYHVERVMYLDKLSSLYKDVHSKRNNNFALSVCLYIAMFLMSKYSELTMLSWERTMVSEFLMMWL